MKNKKGFTLIELLAVIVILAIIALIATPIILNMINEARKSAAKSSTLGYVDSIEAYAGFNQISDETEIKGYDVSLPTMTNKQVTCTKTSAGWDDNCESFMEAVDKKNKGKSPDTATIIISESGKVLGGTIMGYNGYTVTYDGKDATIGGKSSGGSTPTSNFGGKIDKSKQYSSTDVEQKGLVGVAYLDPTNLSKKCTTGVSTTGTKTGCMKWYIFDDSGDTYKMILDHNTTATVLWANREDYIESGGSSGDWRYGSYTKQGPVTVTKQLNIDTEGWVGNPRLVDANEIAHIVGADRTDTLKWNKSKSYGTSIETQSSLFYLDGGKNSEKNSYSTSVGWHKQVANSKGASDYAWLYDYTNGCIEQGCNIEDASNLGYWSNDAVNGLAYGVWSVSREGKLQYIDAFNDNRFGIRPVITIEKSKLQ